MRKLSFVFIIIFAFIVNAPAQALTIKQAFDRGTQAARAAQYDAALENYRKAILLSEKEKINDEFLARVYFNIGVCLYQLKQIKEAVEEFNKAIELSRREYQKVFYALGMAQAELKNWRAAEKAFRESINLRKEDGEAWFDLALVLLEENDLEAAQASFQNAIKYKSIASADAHNNLGVILTLRGDISSAENEFETALRESGGKSVEARNNLQFCKSQKQDFNQNLSAKLELRKF